MRSEAFWDFFNTVARPQLALRADTFAAAFTYLDRQTRPVGIVETGCLRKADNWEGDGQSTLLFDRYAEHHPGSFVATVDINAEATAICRSLVGAAVRITTGDSVNFLRDMAAAPPPELPALDLLYLDSFDVDFDDPMPAAIHHMKEFVAASPLITAETLVMVDDSPSSFLGVLSVDSSFSAITDPQISGKGKLIADYARHVGAEQRFAGYQCGWIKFRRRHSSGR